jgi:Holliday junction resolvase RusA-like endonuclease
VKFTVYGVPVPQGSARAFVVGRVIQNAPGHRVVENPTAVVQPDNKQPLNHWRTQIANEARMAMNTANRGLIAEEDGLDFDGPIRISAVFAFNRPKSIKPAERPHPTVKPDLDKLIRAVLDALTGVLFRDDAQVIQFGASKVYLSAPGSEYLELTVENPT